MLTQKQAVSNISSAFETAYRFIDYLRFSAISVIRSDINCSGETAPISPFFLERTATVEDSTSLAPTTSI